MADENVPLSWYAILNTSTQPYLDRFELMRDPRLEPLDFNGQKFGKLTCTAFDGYMDYEGVLHEARELVALLTGTLRIRQEPGPLSIVNIVGVFEDGREEKFPPHGRPVRLRLGIGIIMRKPGVEPRPTTEQYIVEYVVRSGDLLVKDVLRYMSSSPDFFGLFKILEVISWDLGKGLAHKQREERLKEGYRLIRERGWVSEEKLKDFQFTAHKAHRHWDENRPAPKMDLQEARLIFSRIIEEWVAERAGLQLPPVNIRPGWHA